MYYFYLFLSIIIFIIIVTIPLSIISEKHRKRELEKIFGGRQELSEKDFYEEYFQRKGVPFFVVQKIRQILEEVLDADLSRLSAEDDFSKNLNFYWQEDSLADVEIFEQIEVEFDIKFHQSDFENLNSLTIRQIVEITWRKIQEKEI